MHKSTERQAKNLGLTSALADRLMDDIRQRGLKPGETYLSSREAARFLGVAGASANRALQLLEKRKVIQRAQKRGCILLEPQARGTQSIDQVHFLVHDKYYRTEGVGGDGILFGIQSVLPGSTISHCFLPQENDSQQVSHLIDRSLRQETSDAFVLVRASYVVQQMVARSGLPAMVFGGLYPGIEELGQIDRDHRQAATLLIDYLKSKKCRKPAVLMRQTVLPGDHPTLDCLQESGLKLTTRFVPSEDACIRAVTASLLDAKNRPDGILCQTVRQAECVEQLRAERNLSLPIVVLTTYLKANEQLSFPHIELDCDPETIGRCIGELLLKSTTTQKRIRRSVPVKFVDHATTLYTVTNKETET